MRCSVRKPLARWPWNHWSSRLHRHHRAHHLALVLNGEYVILLIPGKDIRIMDTVSVGHTDTLALVQLDQHGNPMLTPVAYDSPPAWTNAPGSPPVDALVVAADGTSAVATAQNPGQDTISVAAVVGGKSFSASLQLSVTPEPQVLTSVAIQGTVA